MDILVISNIVNNFSKIIFNKNKTQNDIEYLIDFLEDPFSLNLNHLKIHLQNLQYGGALGGVDPSKIAGFTGAAGDVAGAADVAAAAPVLEGMASGVAGDVAAAAPGLLDAAGAAAPGLLGAAAKAAGAAGIPKDMESLSAVEQQTGILSGVPPSNFNMSAEETKEIFSDKDKMKEYINTIKEEVGNPEPDEESSLVNFLNLIVTVLIYPFIFIFLMIYPYIYVTMTSFKKLIKSYRNNVLTF